MDVFSNGKAVRLRSHHDKYLVAQEDKESVTQDRNGSSTNTLWTVELVSNSQSVIRLKSCYGKYLTASHQHFLLGLTGHKVVQSLPNTLGSELNWEPIKEGKHFKLKTGRNDNFLRANGLLPPWRNSVTHDVPQSTATKDWILWDIDFVENQVDQSSSGQNHSAQKTPPQSSGQSHSAQKTRPPPRKRRRDKFRGMVEALSTTLMVATLGSQVVDLSGGGGGGEKEEEEEEVVEGEEEGEEEEEELGVGQI